MRCFCSRNRLVVARAFRGQISRQRVFVSSRRRAFTTDSSSSERPSDKYSSAAFKAQVEKDALGELTPVTFKELIQFGEMHLNATTQEEKDQILIASANFVLTSQPRRLARIIGDMQALPHGVSATPSVRKLLEQYYGTYETYKSFGQVKSIEEENHFNRTIHDRISQHRNVTAWLCAAILEAHYENPSMSISDSPFLNEFVHKIQKQRIACRIMLAQHMSMHLNRGSIIQRTEMKQVLEEAIEIASAQCRAAFGRCPHVRLREVESESAPKDFFTMPQHIRDVADSLLKNAMRASLEADARCPLSADSLPPDCNLVCGGARAVDVIIAHSQTEVSLKISDIGGGIRREDMDKVWLYSYSTGVAKEKRHSVLSATSESKEPLTSKMPALLDVVSDAPFSGLGYGLPIAKLYAEHYLGRCQLHSVHGYGTDAYLFLANAKDSDQLALPSAT